MAVFLSSSFIYFFIVKLLSQDLPGLFTAAETWRLNVNEVSGERFTDPREPALVWLPR